MELAGEPPKLILVLLLESEHPLQLPGPVLKAPVPVPVTTTAAFACEAAKTANKLAAANLITVFILSPQLLKISVLMFHTLYRLSIMLRLLHIIDCIAFFGCCLE
jgi:hypothetical protein